MDPSTPVPVVYGVDELALFAWYGVGDMVGVEGAEDRIVRISARLDVVCPMHAFELRPDGCRSYRFLAGEAR